MKKSTKGILVVSTIAFVIGNLTKGLIKDIRTGNIKFYEDITDNTDLDIRTKKFGISKISSIPKHVDRVDEYFNSELGE